MWHIFLIEVQMKITKICRNSNDNVLETKKLNWTILSLKSYTLMKRKRRKQITDVSFTLTCTNVQVKLTFFLFWHRWKIEISTVCSFCHNTWLDCSVFHQSGVNENITFSKEIIPYYTSFQFSPICCNKKGDMVSLWNLAAYEIDPICCNTSLCNQNCIDLLLQIFCNDHIKGCRELEP